jgi:hypothetical protein
MADTYGKIIFSKSKDCKCNFENLLNTLNFYRWSYCGGEWVMCDDTSLPEYDTYNSEYPTALPDKISSVLIDSDGEDVWIPYDGIVDKDELEKVEYSQTSLDEICSDLAQAIEVGWIEIGVCSNTKLRDAYFEVIKIYADGRGYYHTCETGRGSESAFFTDYTSNWD